MATLEKDTMKRLPTGAKTLDGYEATRYHWVSGLTGPPARRVYEALTTNGVEFVMDPHPYIPGLIVSHVDFMADQAIPSAGLITVSYRDASLSIFDYAEEPSETGEPQIRVQTRLVEVETEVDIHGDQIHTNHKYLINNEPVAKRQNATVKAQMPVTMVQYRRREPSSPGTKSKNFTGRTNKTPVFGDPHRWWLCTGIEGESADGGATYDVFYSFQRTARYCFTGLDPSLQDWSAVVVAVDERTGRPVTDPVLGEGIRPWTVQPSAEFRDLHLTA